MTTSRTVGFLVTMLLAAGGAGSPGVARANDKPVLSLTAFAIDISRPGGGRAGTLDIVIERWSTDEERDRLRDTLTEKGSDALLSALRDIRPRAGYIRTSTSLGWDVQFAREHPLEGGGLRVIVATDRPLSFWELWARPRRADYGFTLAEIRLAADGRGEGKLVPAAKVTWNEAARAVEVENYAFEPVRLTEVRIVGDGKKK